MTTSFAGPGIAQFLQRLNPLRNNDSDVELNGTEDKGNEPEEGEEEEEQLHYEITEDVPANIKKYGTLSTLLHSARDRCLEKTSLTRARADTTSNVTTSSRDTMKVSSSLILRGSV